MQVVKRGVLVGTSQFGARAVLAFGLVNENQVGHFHDPLLHRLQFIARSLSFNQLRGFHRLNTLGDMEVDWQGLEGLFADVGLPPQLGALVTTAITMIFSYLGHKYFTFRLPTNVGEVSDEVFEGDAPMEEPGDA